MHKLWKLGVVLVLAAAVGMIWNTRRGQAQSSVQIQTVVSDLEIPWAAQFAGDGRLFLTERPGRIRIIRNGKLDSQPWATIPVAHVGEGGLLGLALAPDFTRSKFVYVYYTYQADGHLWNRITRLIDRNGRGEIDRVIFDQIPGAVVHDGGRIKFGPDGKLYVGTGDARQPSQAQDRVALGGKILRINPDGSIPADNPFVGSAVYSFGHRNVQGLAWHPLAATMYASEHGPTGEFGLCCRDKVNVIKPGSNYGWPVVAGRAGDYPRFIDPIADSGSSDTWAPSGILVPSRGPWQNSVVVTELRGASLRRLLLTGTGFAQVGSQEVYFRDELGRLRDVFEGPDGTLYLLTNNTDGRGAPRPHDDRMLKIVFS